MLKLKIVQAEYGDCLLLEYGASTDRHFMLIDGGPKNIYKDHLAPELQSIQKAGRKLDVVVLSHIDEDHILGLLDLTSELRQQALQGLPQTIQIDSIWHNTFSETLGKRLEKKIAELEQLGVQVRSLAGEGAPEPYFEREIRSVAQGDELTQAAAMLGIRINPHFAPHTLICPDDTTAPVQLGSLKVTLLGPTRKNLEKLRQDWNAWLNNRKKALSLEDPLAASRAAAGWDNKVPNLSSIIFLAQADGKSILFTGDGRADHLLKNIQQLGLVEVGGRFHVDVFKVPHHGSRRNISAKVFETITADTYIISANGRDGNPDLETLEWLVKAAKKQNRQVTIIATNETRSIQQFKDQYPEQDWGYHLVLLPTGKSALTLDLEAGAYEFSTPTSPSIEVSVSHEGGVPMSKKALLVGINNFINPGWALRGCINDTVEMQSVLKTYYGFEDDNIKLLHDRDATYDGIRQGLEWLLSDYNGSDVRVFHFSSHGTQVDDDSEDELEALDEVIVPYNHSWSTPFRDDHLRQIFDEVPEGVNFTFIADCCHSGSIQRGLFDMDIDFRPRYLPPPLEVTAAIQQRQMKRDAEADAYAAAKLHEMLVDVPQSKWATMIPVFLAQLRKRYEENRYGIVDYEKHILLAGCQDRQTSADAFIEGKYCGAFTWGLVKSIREANGELTYEDLIRCTYGHLTKFEQKPQLEGPAEHRKNKIFAPLA